MPRLLQKNSCLHKMFSLNSTGRQNYSKLFHQKSSDETLSIWQSNTIPTKHIPLFFMLFIPGSHCVITFRIYFHSSATAFALSILLSVLTSTKKVNRNLRRLCCMISKKQTNKTKKKKKASKTSPRAESFLRRSLEANEAFGHPHVLYTSLNSGRRSLPGSLLPSPAKHDSASSYLYAQMSLSRLPFICCCAASHRRS